MRIEIDEKSWRPQPKIKSKSKHESIGEMSKIKKEMNGDFEKFQQMFGMEEMRKIGGMVKQEKKKFSARDRIKLGAKMKKVVPMCDNCHFYTLGKNDKHCDPHKVEKDITFSTGEVLNDFPIEVCEKFKFKK